MMFLEAVAKYYSGKPDGGPDDHCFVFPNRRSGLFFKRFLVKHATKTRWAPRIVTINELMQELSGIAPADPLDLLFGLYDIYASKFEKPESFDSFYPWGEMMISDFDTLDKYLADPLVVFKNISELKEIDEAFGGLEEEQVEFIRKFWKGFFTGDPSREKEMFLTTWKLLPKLYGELKAHCQQQKIGYEGMIYRSVAEEEMVSLHEKLKSDHYVFVGFNALSNSEKSLFSKLRKREMASFFWDYDEGYITDASMEAGRFMRHNIVQFPPPVDLGIFRNLEKAREIRIFDLPSDILQAKTVYQVLAEREDKVTEANDTAIIACDENLLMPVLVSLPEQIDQVNITMGYPFNNTPLFSFIEGVLKLYRNARTSSAGQYGFYNRDVLSVLNHQYYRLISGEDPAVAIRKIAQENHVYVMPAFFPDGFAQILFREVHTVAELCSLLNGILRYILDRLLNEEEHQYRELEKEYILVMQGRLNKLTQIIGERSDFELATFMRIFRRIMSSRRIPFTGEPLAGLQVMGILETRLLDFNHVVMLSVNEDVMPAPSAGHSFIPYSMRYAYGLPTREDMDAIYAYYFYRVIQRAGKVDLFYKSAAEGVRSGEMSRYLYQMKYRYGARMVRPVMQISASGKNEILIGKNAAIMDALERFTEAGGEAHFLSPSALNTYIECSLKFYFRKVMRVDEQEEVLEELDAIGFGNVLHRTIQELYEPLSDGNKLISRSELLQLAGSAQLDTILGKVFREEYFHTSRNRAIEGRNLVILAILKKYLKQVIRYDASLAPLEILELEQRYEMVKHIEVPGAERRIRLGGVIDRVDRLEDGVTRIIDYKTGNPDLKFLSVASLFDKENGRRSKEAFQALVYASLYAHHHPGEPLRPGLYITRKMFEEGYDPAFHYGAGRTKQFLAAYSEVAGEFEEQLSALLKEIFDPAIPFMQTTVSEHCKYCDFRKICDRS
jgi:CRISPR/Cas system-associated exonuclease Cas4 (RecB family)